MHAARKLKKTEAQASFGLAAFGSAGDWEVSIDETTSGARKWFVQIESRAVSLYFAIPSPRVIGEMLEFLTAEPGKGSVAHEPGASHQGEILLGKSKDEPVTLVRDDEYPDRFFLIGEGKQKFLCRITIGGEDLKCFVGALEQAKEELDQSEAD